MARFARICLSINSPWGAPGYAKLKSAPPIAAIYMLPA
jgi:hypothetical protein